MPDIQPLWAQHVGERILRALAAQGRVIERTSELDAFIREITDDPPHDRAGIGDLPEWAKLS